MHRGLGIIKQYQMSYTKSCQLTTQLATDTSGCPRYHHDLSGKIRLDLLCVYLDFLPTKQILNPDFSDNSFLQPVTQNVYGWSHQVFHAMSLTVTYQPFRLPLSCFRRRK